MLRTQSSNFPKLKTVQLTTIAQARLMEWTRLKVRTSILNKWLVQHFSWNWYLDRQFPLAATLSNYVMSTTNHRLKWANPCFVHLELWSRVMANIVMIIEQATLEKVAPEFISKKCLKHLFSVHLSPCNTIYRNFIIITYFECKQGSLINYIN